MTEKQEKRRSRRLQGLPADLPLQVQQEKPVKPVKQASGYIRYEASFPSTACDGPVRRKLFRCGNEQLYHPQASCFSWPRDDPVEENSEGGRILRDLAKTYGEKEEASSSDLDTMMQRPVMSDGFRALVERGPDDRKEVIGSGKVWTREEDDQ